MSEDQMTAPCIGGCLSVPKRKAKMKNRSWKAAETRFARDVGQERKPCDGTRDGADFEDGLACYQLKIRKSIPGWLWGWLAGVQGHAASKGKLGVLVLKKPRQEDTEAVVVLSWQAWCDLHGSPRTQTNPKLGCTDASRSESAR